MDKQTSDERLLEIIEDSSDPKHKRLPLLGLKKPLAAFSPAKLNLAELKSRFKNLKINLFILNKGLMGVASLLTLLFLFTLFSAPVISKSNAAFFTPADAAAVAQTITAIEAQGLMRQSISNQDVKRNFFLSSGSKAAGVDAQEEIPDLKEEVKDLKLVGIIWSQNPEVMIENAKDSRTYTLKKGESLNEQVKVKDVSRNSAVLEVTAQAGTMDYEIR